MSTAGWLSAAVENTCDFFAGIVVFFSMIELTHHPLFQYQESMELRQEEVRQFYHQTILHLESLHQSLLLRQGLRLYVALYQRIPELLLYQWHT